MRHVVLAANNAEVGGGEVMLLETAAALRDLGVRTSVVGPSVPGGVLDEAAAAGHPVHRLPAGRREHLVALRAWDRRRSGWLWCHGLVPSLATAGHPGRVVHLHQAPSVRHRAAVRLARAGAAAVLVPSEAMTGAVPGAEVLWNWTGGLPRRTVPVPGRPVRVGYIGRHSVDKGLDVLADAVAALDAADPGGWRLVLAGDGRFVRAAQTARVETALARVGHLTDRLGWCGRADLFDAVDLAVVPSRWAEPFGLVAAEAMSAGVPLVVTDAGALPEVVGPEHPWVAPAGDADRLADVVAACAAATADERGRVVEAAHARWVTHFSPAAGTARVADLLVRLREPAGGWDDGGRDDDVPPGAVAHADGDTDEEAHGGASPA